MKKWLLDLAEELHDDAEWLHDPVIVIAEKVKAKAEEPLILHTLTYDCGDYYCDSMHLMGVFESQEEAERVRDTFKADPTKYFPVDPIYPNGWQFAVGPIELGKVYDGS